MSEEILEQIQQQVWREQDTKNDLVHVLNRYDTGFDASAIYDAILLLPYEQAQPLIYLLGKMRLMIQMCDFLTELSDQDTEKARVFHLISHAEIAMRTFAPSQKGGNATLVRSFFGPVEAKFEKQLQLSLTDTSRLKSKPTASRIFYQIRNAYAHHGDFTGRIFNPRSEIEMVSPKVGSRRVLKITQNLFTFQWSDKSDVTAICGMTYQDFLKLYFTAFLTHLDQASKSAPV